MALRNRKLIIKGTIISFFYRNGSAGPDGSAGPELLPDAREGFSHVTRYNHPVKNNPVYCIKPRQEDQTLAVAVAVNAPNITYNQDLQGLMVNDLFTVKGYGNNRWTRTTYELPDLTPFEDGHYRWKSVSDLFNGHNPATSPDVIGRTTDQSSGTADNAGPPSGTADTAGPSNSQGGGKRARKPSDVLNVGDHSGKDYVKKQKVAVPASQILGINFDKPMDLAAYEILRTMPFFQVGENSAAVQDLGALQRTFEEHLRFPATEENAAINTAKQNLAQAEAAWAAHMQTNSLSFTPQERRAWQKQETALRKLHQEAGKEYKNARSFSYQPVPYQTMFVAIEDMERLSGNTGGGSNAGGGSNTGSAPPATGTNGTAVATGTDDSGIDGTPVAVPPATGTNPTAVATGIDGTPVVVTPATGTNGTAVATGTDDSGIDGTPVAAPPATGTNPTAVATGIAGTPAVPPATGTNGTAVAASPATGTNVTPVAVLPAAGTDAPPATGTDATDEVTTPTGTAGVRADKNSQPKRDGPV